MTINDVLIGSILTEKASKQQESLKVYSFKVNLRANKLQIKKAIEFFYGIKVVKVNVAVVSGKNKSKQIKKTLVHGVTSSYKKAFVSVGESEKIDLYNNI